MGKEKNVHIRWNDGNTSEREVLSTSRVFLINESLLKIFVKKIELNFILMFLMFWTYRVWWDNISAWNQAIDWLGQV